MDLFLDLYEVSRKLLEVEVMETTPESDDTYRMNLELLSNLEWFPASRDVIRRVLVLR